MRLFSLPYVYRQGNYCIWEVFHTNNWNAESHLHSWAMKMCKTLMTWFALSFQVFIPLKAHKVCEPSNFLHIQNIWVKQ